MTSSTTARPRRRSGSPQGAPRTQQHPPQQKQQAPQQKQQAPQQKQPAPQQKPAPVVVPDGVTFADLGVPAPLVESLARDGITAPFAIQAATVAHGLAGLDVLGKARTGSGKTLAFALPLVARLAAGGTRRTAGRPRALVLAPTRELANQIGAVLAPLAKAMGLTHTLVFGGVGQNPQVTALRAGVDIVVACPGRLEDLLRQGHLTLAGVEVSVLDEADHMADLGFLPSVKRLLDATAKGGQRLLFSATLDGDVDVLVRRYLRDPQRVSIETPAEDVADMTHHVLEVAASDKPAVVRALAGGQGRTVLFTRTKHQAKKLAKTLTQAGTPAVDLHGNLSQGARERNLAAFSAGEALVLVATDIAARGIHVDDVSLVVHVDPPADHKAYLHRSGRTARAGAAGTVVTLQTPEQHRDVLALTKAAGITAPRTRVAAGHELLGELAGPPAPYREPAPVVAAAPKRPAARPAQARTGGQARTAGAGRRRRGR